MTSAPPGLPPPLVPTPPEARTRTILRPAATFYGLVVLFALGYAVFSGRSAVLFGDAAPTAGWLLGGLATGLVVVGACHVGRRTVPAIDRAADALTGLLGPVTYETAVILAFLSGFAEELLFRGALWHLGLLGTTFLFGLVHVVPRKGLIGYPVFAAAAGALFGLLREMSDSVVPAILAHVTVNALNLVWLERRRRAAETPAAAPSAPAAPPAVPAPAPPPWASSPSPPAWTPPPPPPPASSSAPGSGFSLRP